VGRTDTTNDDAPTGDDSNLTASTTTCSTCSRAFTTLFTRTPCSRLGFLAFDSSET